MDQSNDNKKTNFTRSRILQTLWCVSTTLIEKKGLIDMVV